LTIRGAIDQVRNLKPNQYDDETLVGWLSDLDGQIWQDLLCHYGDAGMSAPQPYEYEKDLETELLIERPHEEIYVIYLCAKVDYQNGEFDRYNNAMMMVMSKMEAYQNAYNRMHMPRQDAYIGI